jgi:hypothetical protein
MNVGKAENLSAVALDLIAAAAEIYMHCRAGHLSGGETGAVLRGLLDEMEDLRDDGRADYEKLHARRAPGGWAKRCPCGAMTARRAARCNHRCGTQ